jgi:hypothetical protein
MNYIRFDYLCSERIQNSEAIRAYFKFESSYGGDFAVDFYYKNSYGLNNETGRIGNSSDGPFMFQYKEKSGVRYLTQDYKIDNINQPVTISARLYYKLNGSYYSNDNNGNDALWYVCTSAMYNTASICNNGKYNPNIGSTQKDDNVDIEQCNNFDYFNGISSTAIGNNGSNSITTNGITTNGITTNANGINTNILILLVLFLLAALVFVIFYKSSNKTENKLDYNQHEEMMVDKLTM